MSFKERLGRTLLKADAQDMAVIEELCRQRNELLEAHEPSRDGADFLDWVADRLVHKYGESENVDFIICLRRRAEKARAAIAKAEAAQ